MTGLMGLMKVGVDCDCDQMMIEQLNMHILILPVSATCYSSNAIYPDAERVIWMRSANSELAYMVS